MFRSGHIKSTAEKFGGKKIAESYEWVHDWLDSVAQRGVKLNKHRQYRHHERALRDEFISFIKDHHAETDMDLALQIARQHILDDLGCIPENEIDFIIG